MRGSRPAPGHGAVPRRQERGEERRRQVLEAALRLLAREGPRGITHRAVAKEAGTSLRATTYYFASREVLLTEALAHYADTALERFARIQTTGTPVDEDPLEAAVSMLADAVVSDLLEDRGGLVAEYELVLEISRKGARRSLGAGEAAVSPDPELAACYARWQEALLSVLEAAAALLGSEVPGLHARLVLATLRGLELEALARPATPPDREALRPVFRALLQGLVAGHPAAVGEGDREPR